MPTPEQVADFRDKADDLIQQALELMYHPAAPVSFTDPREVHTDRRLVSFTTKFGVRRVTVDTRIAPLIGEIWRCGFHTLGSCQEQQDGRAYIQFPGMCWGGNSLVAAIKRHGSEASVEEPAISNGFDFKAGDEQFGCLKFVGVTVRFDPNLIEPLTSELRSINDRDGSPTFEVAHPS